MSININTLNQISPSAKSEAAGNMAFDLLDLRKYQCTPDLDICDYGDEIRNDIDEALEILKNSGLEFNHNDAAAVAFAFV